MNLLSPALCMIAVFVWYMAWRNAYIYKMQLDWSMKVFIGGLMDWAKNQKYTYTPERMLGCIYSFDKMIFKFWLFGIDAMVEDREVYNYVMERFNESLKERVKDES